MVADDPDSERTWNLRRASIETHRDTWLTAAIMTLLVMPHTLPVSLPAIGILVTVGGKLRACDWVTAGDRVVLGRVVTVVAIAFGVLVLLWGWFTSLEAMVQLVRLGVWRRP